jgi:hypothetical protein
LQPKPRCEIAQLALIFVVTDQKKTPGVQVIGNATMPSVLSVQSKVVYDTYAHERRRKFARRPSTEAKSSKGVFGWDF